MAGCQGRALTQLVVVAGTDLNVPSQLDGIEIEITPPMGAPLERAGALFGAGAIELPVSLGIGHRGGALGPVAITARGLRGAEPVVVRNVEVSFVEGRTLVVTLHLEAACVGVVCPTERETCALGACRPIALSRDELREFDGTLPHLVDGGGVCIAVPEICNLADDDCDARVDEGVDVLSSPLHCGVCDNACPPSPHARPTCAAGVCTLACEPGFGDCNADPRDGCEAGLDTLSACGGCGIECGVAHGAATCPLGTCEVAACSPGWGDCNTLDTDGCEARLDDPAHCGGCTPCVAAGATESCVFGTCVIATCDVGLGDCNALALDGCETALTTTAACGACGRACPAVARGAPACAAGSCVVGSCAAGFADCDGSVSTGCETALNTLANCRRCGAACLLAHSSERCGTTGCEVAACNSGWDDCDATAENGCETSLDSLTSCGACGNECLDGTDCQSGLCT